QVVINYKNKSTGQLSFVVTAMTFGGTSARLYTTFMEVDDLPLRLTMMLNWTLVSTLMLQFAIYRDSRPLPPKPTSAESSPAPEKVKILYRRQTSVVEALATFGSSRCLSEMVEREVMDRSVAVIKSQSSHSLSQFARSVSWAAPVPMSTSTPALPSPESLESLEGRQATEPSLGLRRN
ncbi:unnamed protein product, partial [Effrenium voratum]